MIKIDYVKALPGIPADKVIRQDIIDQKIISRPYVKRIADYILDSKGRAWWIAQGILPATIFLSQFDTVEFWADGVHYNNKNNRCFLPVHPQGNFSRSQGITSIIWNITIWYLK